jgi:hypothetical protein
MKLGLENAPSGAIQTFVTVDFFNHDTQHTDINSGYTPQFNTQFVFRNKVDDFYIKYLHKEYIIAEVFAVKGHGTMVTEKIGEAKLPLRDVLQENQDEKLQSQTHF